VAVRQEIFTHAKKSGTISSLFFFEFADCCFRLPYAAVAKIHNMQSHSMRIMGLRTLSQAWNKAWPALSRVLNRMIMRVVGANRSRYFYEQKRYRKDLQNLCIHLLTALLQGAFD